MTRRATDSNELRFAQSEASSSGEYSFHDQAWSREHGGGLVEVGALLPVEEVDPTRPIRLATTGSQVYEGLPLGTYHSSAGCLCLLPSPVSGRVVARSPEAVARLASGGATRDHLAWIVRISPSSQAPAPQYRDVVLVDGAQQEAARLHRQLTHLGCRVWPAPDLDEGLKQSRRLGGGVCVVDSREFDQRHHETIRNQARQTTPVQLMIVEPEPTKLVLFQSCGISSFLEDPGARDRLVFELDRLFSPARRAVTPAGEAHLEPWRSRIRTTDVLGQETTFIIARRLLEQFAGLGRQLTRALADRRLPAIVGPEKRRVSQEVLEASEPADRRVVWVRPGPGAGIPGTITRVGPLRTEPNPAGKEAAAIEISVQPAPDGILPMVFDFQTTCALAQRIVEIGIDPSEA